VILQIGWAARPVHLSRRPRARLIPAVRAVSAPGQPPGAPRLLATEACALCRTKRSGHL